MTSPPPTRYNDKHSEPIAIPQNQHGRTRSESVSSDSSSAMSSAPSELPTPLNSTNNIPRIGIATSGTSPILSYFLGQQSPTNKASTFPFRRSLHSNTVFEDEILDQKEAPVTTHTRRASVSVAERFSQPAMPVSEPQQERTNGMLRRLSLSSSAFTRPGRPISPPAPPHSAVSLTSKGALSQEHRPRRSATLGFQAPRRAPSPMGERILKGHFDGFN